MSHKPKSMMSAAAALLVAAAWHCAPVSASQLSQEQISWNVSPGTEVRSIAVSYGDLNLKTHAGVVALYHRIDVAAKYACGSRYLTGSRAASPYWTACKDRAAREAIYSLDIASLSNYARQQAVLAHAGHPAKADGVKRG
jgi:UrcA family protein